MVPSAVVEARRMPGVIGVSISTPLRLCTDRLERRLAARAKAPVL